MFKGSDKQSPEDSKTNADGTVTNPDGSITYKDGHILFSDGDNWYPGPPPYIVKSNGSKVTDPDSVAQEKIDDSAATAFAKTQAENSASGGSNTKWYVMGAAAIAVIVGAKFLL